MKKVLLVLLIIGLQLFPFLTWSQEENEKRYGTEVEQVRVYLNGATLYRSADVTVKPGRNTIVFEGLTGYVDQNSIQVGAPSGIQILSVKFRKNYQVLPEKKAQIKEVEDSVKLLDRKIGRLEARQLAYQDEYEMVISNKVIGGEKTKASVTELNQQADFFRQRIFEIKEALAGFQRDLKKLREKRGRLQQQLQALNGNKQVPTGEIIVQLRTDRSQTIQLDCNYYTRKAGWSPIYDLRAQGVNDSVTLNYKANVWQRTYVDWEQVDLTLSTGTAQQGGNPPSMSTWWVDFYTPRRAQYNYQQRTKGTGQMAKQEAAAPMKKSAQLEDKGKERVKVQEKTLSTDFEVQTPYTIPSDGKQHLVAVKDYRLPARFQHFAIPRKRESAYLVGYVTDWEQYHLQDGPANIFFQNTFVGRSSLKANQMGDSLRVSFGIDPGINIKREKNKDFTDEQFIGNKKEDQFGYRITIRNTNSESVKLIVKDQIPLSKHEDIEVTLEDKGEAEHLKEKGYLVWRFSMDPKSTRKLDFGYSIKYPKDKTLDIY